jgi:cytochrome o ubiquinol oxidase subunit 1
MPKNTASGIYISGFVFLIGFAMVWHIIWLAVIGVIGALIIFIQRAFDEKTTYIIPAAEVARLEKENK